MSVKVKLKKGDLVQVMSGKDKGKKGKIIKIFLKDNKAIVEKVNFVKRHQRPTKMDQQGGIREKELPVHISNLMYVCKKCSNPTRIGYLVSEAGEKFRICKKCKEVVETK